MMSLVEEAIYRKLLDYCWLEGSIDADCSRLQRLIGKGSSISDIENVVEMFSIHPDDPSRFIHDRLDMQRKEQEDFSNQQSEKAKKRWAATKAIKDSKSPSDAMALPKECHGTTKGMPKSIPVQCPTPTPTPTPNKRSCPKTDGLEILWKSSPRKSRERSSRQQVDAEWKKIKIADRPKESELIEAITAWSKSEKWATGYAEGLHLWVKNRQWENLPEPIKEKGATSCL